MKLLFDVKISVKTLGGRINVVLQEHREQRKYFSIRYVFANYETTRASMLTIAAHHCAFNKQIQNDIKGY